MAIDALPQKTQVPVQPTKRRSTGAWSRLTKRLRTLSGALPVLVMWLAMLMCTRMMLVTRGLAD